MYHVSAQGVDERMINVHYCYCQNPQFVSKVSAQQIVLVFSDCKSCFYESFSELHVHVPCSKQLHWTTCKWPYFHFGSVKYTTPTDPRYCAIAHDSVRGPCVNLKLQWFTLNFQFAQNWSTLLSPSYTAHHCVDFIITIIFTRTSVLHLVTLDRCMALPATAKTVFVTETTLPRIMMWATRKTVFHRSSILVTITCLLPLKPSPALELGLILDFHHTGCLVACRYLHLFCIPACCFVRFYNLEGTISVRSPPGTDRIFPWMCSSLIPAINLSPNARVTNCPKL